MAVKTIYVCDLCGEDEMNVPVGNILEARYADKDLHIRIYDSEMFGESKTIDVCPKCLSIVLHQIIGNYSNYLEKSGS